MSKLNTDTNKKEFWKKFGMSGWQHKVWNSTDEIWNWIDQALQQAYQKGREEEREKFIADLASLLMRTDNNPTAKDLVELQEYYLKLKKK